VAPLDENAPELYVSPQIEKLLGFSQAEWLADPVLWHRQLHPEDAERWNYQFAPTCTNGEPFSSTYRFIAKDGRVVWVHGSANMVADADGRFLFLQGMAFDITSIKEAEEERERFFSISIDLYCVAGFDGHFQRVNQAFTRTLGYAAAELLSRPVLDFVHPEDREATEAELRRLAGDGVIAGFTNRCRCKDGSYRWLEWVATPFPERQLIYAAARDVTEKKRDEAILRQTNAELERRVQERTETLARSMAELQEKTAELDLFAYVASHDLKEPLRSLVNYPQKLAKNYLDQLDEQARKWINQIIEGGERMRRLIEDLAQYSRTLRRDQQLVPTDCASVVREACSNLQASIEESNAELVVGSLPTVPASPQRLVLLFQNLIGNAIKFRAPERRVRVEIGARSEGSSWLFWVRDNGIGIDGKYYKKVFLLGVESRLHSTKKYPGTGFGLAICDKIVAGHAGRIWVESQPDQGSTFYFTLPAATAP